MIRKILIVACVWLLCSVVSSTAMAQNVTNVSAEQVGKNIVVSYDLNITSNVSLCYSSDGGKTFSQPIKQVTGDVGKGVSAGHKTITWNVLNELEKLVCDNLVFKVIAHGENMVFNLKGLRFEMVFVEGGTFTRSDAYHQGLVLDHEHSVTLSDYYIGKYEVTQSLWETVMGRTVSQIASEANVGTHGVGANYPMYYISWNACKTFISKLNNLLSSQLGGKHFALPTEAQWEYAARGGKKSQGYEYYAGSNDLSAVAWYTENSNNSTHTVGTKLPNELGLYDMSGNVHEWCQDWYDTYTGTSQTNPAGASSGTERVRRGGSFDSGAWYCQWLFRGGLDPSYGWGGVGLRLVLIP